ncbi:MAG: MBOAT family O-acyltransferase [Psychroserpens sp.]|uniref:MBOAT family O-acyltransferase n=1 Tax=Psychroserpens sp. TaxID=2020870 RepID=UPI00300272AB
MLFNSIDFLIFFPVVFAIYWMLKNSVSKQNILLLISSYVFYGWWDWRFLSLIVYSSFIDYIAGLKIENSTTKKQRKRWLLLSLVSNLGLLAIFKYYNFFADSFSQAMSTLGWQVDDLTLNIILPVGISFYTFQTLSYTIDIYRKNIKPTQNLVVFFTYVSLFPQLVAGPIERASNLIPQIKNKRVFKSSQFKDGIFQIIVGLFRKIVIADNLAIYVDTVYGSPELHNGSSLLLATVFYAFQIYYDFSGYSDIAIGTAKLLGFNFNQNFNFPYFSKSITEFWRRWHISLSSWLKDYLYISLGGNRKGIKITYRNLLITMLIGGLWHGSSWNFVIWGAIHGVALAIEKYTFSKLKIKNFNVLGTLWTFLVVLLSWVFFRAQDLSSATLIMKRIFSFDYTMPFIGNINTVTIALLMLALGLSFDVFIFRRKVALEYYGSTIKTSSLAVFVSIVIILLALFYSTSNNFIYFQF